MNTWTFAFGWVFAWAIGGGLIIGGVEALNASRKRRRLMDAGLYPKPGAETDADVQQLLAVGQQDMAIRCYKTIHRVTYQQARDRLLSEPATEPAGYYGMPFLGMVLGLGVGAVIRNVGLGMLIGFSFGCGLAAFIRKRRSTTK